MNHSKNLSININRFKFLVFMLLLICFCQHAYSKPVVRVIYFKPANVDDPPDDKLNHLREAIITTEKFYEREMIRHGYGPKTFLTERGKNNKIVITIVNAPKETEAYKNEGDGKIIINDIPDDIGLIMETRKSPFEIRIIFIGGITRYGKGAAHKTSIEKNKKTGLESTFKWCLIPADNIISLRGLIAHELGHAFGFEHVDDPESIMKKEALPDKATRNLETMSINADNAKELDRHHHFQHEELSVKTVGSLPTVWAELKKR